MPTLAYSRDKTAHDRSNSRFQPEYARSLRPPCRMLSIARVLQSVSSPYHIVSSVSRGLQRASVPLALTLSARHRYSTPATRRGRSGRVAGERRVRDLNRRRVARAKSHKASPRELREAKVRLKEIEEELRTVPLAPETKRGEDRERRYTRILRLRALRETSSSASPMISDHTPTA